MQNKRRKTTNTRSGYLLYDFQERRYFCKFVVLLIGRRVYEIFLGREKLIAKRLFWVECSRNIVVEKGGGKL